MNTPEELLSRISFLETNQERLHRQMANAIRYAQDDPEAALLKVRLVLEAVLFQIYERFAGKEGERPSCALFEADGGGWRLQAILRVAAYLRTELGEQPKVIG